MQFLIIPLPLFSEKHFPKKNELVFLKYVDF